MERTIAKNGERGIAQVSIGKSRVEVVFENEKRFKIALDSIPEFMLGEKFPTSGKFFVKLGRDNDEIASISPVEGNYQVKFLKFGARKDEDPTPMKQKSDYNDSFYFTFMAIFKVTRANLKGCEIAVFLPYRFAEGDDGSAVYVGSDKDNATNVRRLEGFLDVTGLMEKRMRFTDNLLPKMQKLALEEGREFMLSLRNGKVEYFAPLVAVEEDEKPTKKMVDDDDEDEPIAKKRKAPVEEDEAPWDGEDDGDAKLAKKMKTRTREDEAFDGDDEIPF